MNRTTIRAASATLSVIVTSIVLMSLGAVADLRSAATSTEGRMARRAPAASAPVQVATLQHSRDVR